MFVKGGEEKGLSSGPAGTYLTNSWRSSPPGKGTGKLAPPVPPKVKGRFELRNKKGWGGGVCPFCGALTTQLTRKDPHTL